MKLLHIISTPRNRASNTLRLSNAFLEEFSSKQADFNVEVIDLFNVDLPSVAGDNIEAKYSLMAGSKLDQHHELSWRQIEENIESFLDADIYLLSVPMWNFSIPYALKYYIDAIVQPNYLFRYNEQGQPEGLVKGKKMICMTSRGGDYSENSPFHAYDFLEPYLRAIFGFVGITDIQFINAQPMDVTLELRDSAVKSAIEQARELAASIDLSLVNEALEIKNLEGLKPSRLEN